MGIPAPMSRSLNCCANSDVQPHRQPLFSRSARRVKSRICGGTVLHDINRNWSLANLTAVGGKALVRTRGCHHEPFRAWSIETSRTTRSEVDSRLSGVFLRNRKSPGELVVKRIPGRGGTTAGSPDDNPLFAANRKAKLASLLRRQKAMEKCAAVRRCVRLLFGPGKRPQGQRGPAFARFRQGPSRLQNGGNRRGTNQSLAARRPLAH